MRRVRKFRLAAIIAAGVVTLAAGASGEGESGRFALVLIDADGLACSPCSDPLRKLGLAVPPVVQEERMFGILIYRPAGRSEEAGGRIARTKWSGYSRTNGIFFRAVLDDNHDFERPRPAGAAVLLIDTADGTMKRFPAPFDPGVLEEIVRFLIGSEPGIMDEIQ